MSIIYLNNRNSGNTFSTNKFITKKINIITRVNTVNGEVIFTDTGVNYWLVPDGVYWVSAVCVGGGGGGSYSRNGGAGGAGGGLAYKNNISVTPGQTITAFVGAGGARAVTEGGAATEGQQSFFKDGTTCAASYGSGAFAATVGGISIGTYVGDGGGEGGSGGSGSTQDAGGGGGAGGYSGNGGNGANLNTAGSAGSGGGGGGGGAGGGADCAGGGGGVGIFGEGANGAGGSYGGSDGGGGGGGSGGTAGGDGGPTIGEGGNYGGGGGGAENINLEHGPGAQGVVRVVWRTSDFGFPSTNVGAS